MNRSEKRRTYVGVVTSNAPDKTITVKVDTYRSHPLYGKRYKYSLKIHVHDEKNEAKIGDIVKVMSTRPYSKTKTFRLVEIKESGKVFKK